VGAMIDTEALLEGLTDAQREAVLHTEGPLLVLAGPGSGKTRVITRRVAYLVALGVRPWQILAVTFTNKAAGEMKHRVAAALGAGSMDEGGFARGLTVTTFHSLCARLLRRYGDLAAADGHPVVKSGFSVFDSDDQSKIVKGVLDQLQLSGSNWPPRSVLGAISAAKNELVDADTYASRAGAFFERTMAKAYSGYQKALVAAGGVDFDDLLMLTAKMLRESLTVRGEVQRRYRYLLVDEYQDTNKAQLVIAGLIAGGGGEGGGAGVANICVVGDPDQSIYGWRGADIENILQFEERYPSARVIALLENFRSVAGILSTADRVIGHNKRRKEKPLIAVRGWGGDKGSAAGATVEITLCRDEHHEASLVLDWLRARRERENLDWKDCAIFYRTNALSRVVEDKLRNAGVPYAIVRGTAFYQREEIKNAIAYLRVAVNPLDSVSLGRIVNTPARGIGDAAWEKLELAAQERGTPVLDVLREPGAALGLSGRAANGVQKFVTMIDNWLPQSTSMFGEIIGGLPELVERVIRDSGLEQMYAQEEERLENLAEMVSSAREFEENFDPDAEVDAIDADGNPVPREGPTTLRDVLAAYLERVALVADTDALNPEHGAVTLMTLHAAKGLEYRAVAVIGLEEGMLPHMRAQESEAALEEERRLCFVGITRAMDRLLMTSARFRTIRGLSERTIPSRFIEEARGEGVVVSDQADPFGSGGGMTSDRGMKAYLAGGAGSAGGGPAEGGGRRVEREHEELVPGDHVRHPQFGVGKVKSVMPGQHARAQIEFAGLGVKTIVLEYARLTRV